MKFDTGDGCVGWMGRSCGMEMGVKDWQKLFPLSLLHDKCGCVYILTNGWFRFSKNRIYKQTETHLQCRTRRCVYTFCQPHDDLLLNIGDAARNENVEFFSHLKLDFHREHCDEYICVWQARKKLSQSRKWCVFVCICVDVCVHLCSGQAWVVLSETDHWKWKWNKREMAAQQTHAKRENARDMMCVYTVYNKICVSFSEKINRPFLPLTDEHWTVSTAKISELTTQQYTPHSGNNSFSRRHIRFCVLLLYCCNTFVMQLWQPFLGPQNWNKFHSTKIFFNVSCMLRICRPLSNS